MQPTTGRRTAPLPFMKTRPLQATLALASVANLVLVRSQMRFLALVAALFGTLLVGVGTFGLHTTLTTWDILGRSGAQLGLDPDHWRGHWLATAVVYLVVGLTFIGLAIGLWKHSHFAATAWCVTITALTAAWFFLYVFLPLPYGFQQIPFASWLLLPVSALSAGSFSGSTAEPRWASTKMRSNQPMQPTAGRRKS
jgi:hypothetical protein